MSQNRYRRSRGNLNPSKKIVVYSEGEVTEVTYYNSVREYIEVDRNLFSIKHLGRTDPKGLVRTASEDKKSNEQRAKKGQVILVDEWWVVVDTECSRPKLDEAIIQAKANKIFLAISDPCFEYWLILHFEYTTRGFDSSEKAVKELRKYIPPYSTDKKEPDMNILLPKVIDAAKNAALVRKNHTLQRNMSPRTDCDLLLRALNAQASPDARLEINLDYSFDDLALGN